MNGQNGKEFFEGSLLSLFTTDQSIASKYISSFKRPSVTTNEFIKANLNRRTELISIKSPNMEMGDLSGSP